MHRLDSFFNPKSIAIVGASPNRKKLGNILMQNIVAGGWRGKIYPVNPKHANIGSLKCFASLADIKKPIDLVLIAIPAPYVNGAILEGAKANPKIKNFAVISAGFKESGKAGKKLEDELKNIAHASDLNILGPNCLGFINSASKLNATFASGTIAEGRIAIVSQSGALAVELLDWTQSARIGFSKIVSLGNKAVLDESALIDFLGKDEQTSFLALYLEDIKNGEKFMKSVAAVAGKKPVVVLKAGKTAAGQKAVSSHTGSLAQDSDIINAAFEKLNIIKAGNIEEFQDIIEYLNYASVPMKSEVIVLTNAGGPGVMASDFVGSSSVLKLAKVPAQIQKNLKNILPSAAAVQNPIDVLGDADPQRYEKVLKILAAGMKDYPLIVVLTPQSQSKPSEAVKNLARYQKAFPALAACFMGGKKIQAAERGFKNIGIANFETPERALAVMEKLSAYTHGKKIAKKMVRAGKNPANDPVIKKALAEKRKMLLWQETAKIFAGHGLKLTKSITVDAAKLSGARVPQFFFPCVLKTDDPRIAHRFEKKAVRKNIADTKSLKAALKQMAETTRAKNFLVQPMLPQGLEIIVGMKRDSSFGPVIVVGWGGTYTETFKDRVILIPPLTRGEIARIIRGLKIFPILMGTRGEKGYNLPELENAVLAVQEVALGNEDIQEIDINPMFLYNDGRKAQTVDAKIFLKTNAIKS